MKKLLVLACFFFSIFSFSFKKIDINIFSDSMKKNIPVTIILPDSYNENNKYPTVYTLHGWSGSNKNFPEKLDSGKYADLYNMILVSPDGNYDSWYINTPVDEKSKYETFISKELINYIDSKFSTYKEREKRAITGLSMGGFGSFYLGIKHSDIFGNIGSMSGGVNIEKYKNNWGINKYVVNNFQNYNIKDIASELLGKNTNIIFDCGVDDFFIYPNRELHNILLELNIDHDYIERPGMHSWNYWKNSINYQMYYFNDMFNK